MIAVFLMLTVLTACSARQKKADPGVISFETTDLDGNVVRSADVFKGHRLTMVNVWGTFCGPCIGEMPELEKLNYRLKQKDCAIVGEPAIGARSADNYEELIDELLK